MPRKPKRPTAIQVDIRRPAHAPAEPDSARLATLFTHTLSLVPPFYVPDLQGHTRMTVDIHFVNDADISELNQQHMSIHAPTDVLSFTMAEVDPERQAFNLGEVVVSFETAQRESAARKLPLVEELSRYCVHGFLHLLGYEDETPSKRKAMFIVQEAALKSKPAARTKSKKTISRKRIKKKK